MTNKRIEICILDLHQVGGGGFGKLNPFHKLTWQWQANATNPNESYMAAWSDTFQARGNRDFLTSDLEADKQAREEVVSIMLSEGWIPSNNRYRGQTFTRPFDG